MKLEKQMTPKYTFTDYQKYEHLCQNTRTTKLIFVVNNPELTHDFDNIMNAVVLLDKLYTVKGVERFCHCPPWGIRSIIGLVVEEYRENT